MKNKKIPRTVEVSHDEKKWHRHELIADISSFETQEPYITRMDNDKHKFFIGSFPYMREIEVSEESFGGAWTRTCENIVKSVVDGMPEGAFEIEVKERSVKITAKK